MDWFTDTGIVIKASRGCFRCYGKGGKSPKLPPPAPPIPVPKEAEAEAAKRDIRELNLRRRGRLASQIISPGLLATAPDIMTQSLKDKLG